MAKPSRSKKPAPKKSEVAKAPWIRALKISLVLLLCTVCGIIIAVVSVLFNSTRDAEKLLANLEDKIQDYNSKPSEIYSSDGVLLYRIRPVYRERISLADVPKQVKDAVLAAEDKRFYQHQGVDYVGLIRATLKMAKDRKASQGGSTITMQLAKRLYSASEKNLQRKVQDIGIAIEMEKRMSKDDILELYLNQVYFGERAYGIAAAAEVYFGKKVNQLTLSEAATLARCVRRPSDENPVKDEQKAIDNRDVVLGVMKEEGLITENEYKTAIKEPLKVKANVVGKQIQVFGAPYFVQEVLQQLSDIPIKEGGYRITTTLDYSLQRKAEIEVQRTVNENRRRKVTNAAFVMMDKDGRILAEVGGISFKRSQANAIRYGDGKQPGSSFKPFVYATAFSERVLNEYDSISNDRIVLKGPRKEDNWEPGNNGGATGGSMSVKRAFSNSVNLPAIHTMELIGIKQTGSQYGDNTVRRNLSLGAKAVVTFAKERFGFKSNIRAVPSLPLGANTVKPIELAEAYSVFMLRGSRVRPYSIVKVVGPEGEINLGSITGKVEYPNVVSEDVCVSIDRLLRLVVTSGSGTAASVVPEARGKTGTTNDNKDAWFCGYAKDLIGIGWVGNEVLDKRKRWIPVPMSKDAFGGTITAVMWARIMSTAVEKYGPRANLREPEQDRPRRQEEQEVPPLRDQDQADPEPTEPEIPIPTRPDQDPAGGGAPVPDPADKEKPKRPEPGTKPPGTTQPDDDVEVEVELCADSEKVATPYCPETITRKFKKKNRPRGTCKLHKPAGEDTHHR